MYHCVLCLDFAVVTYTSSPTHPTSSLTFIECGWCARAFFSWTLKMLALTLSSACWCHVLFSHYTSRLKRCVQGGYNTICLACICVHGFVVWCVYDSCPLLATYMYVWSGTWCLGSFCCFGRSINLILATWHHSCEKSYQASPAFPYCKQWMTGWGLGMRLHIVFPLVFVAILNTVSLWSPGS